jgi:hypothetical protein
VAAPVESWLIAYSSLARTSHSVRLSLILGIADGAPTLRIF